MKRLALEPSWKVFDAMIDMVEVVETRNEPGRMLKEPRPVGAASCLCWLNGPSIFSHNKRILS